jgi:hypothetical protein
MLKLYFKVLGVIVLFGLQIAVALPYYFSSSNWYDFTTGWFIVLVADPVIVWYLIAKANWK